jgi:aryl-alcohol dehydrogenase-like predicted oxidoreductase
MQYSTLGSSGLIVSRLAFGAFTFTQGNTSIKSVYKVGAELADELVGHAVDAGVNLFDTSDVYADGESETLLGAALKPYRDKVIVTTKVGNRGGARDPLHSGLSRRHILWSVDQSLARLGTDWIDLYVAHRDDHLTPLEETLEAFDTVVRSGKVRYIGFSNWSPWMAAAAIAFQKANGLARFTHGQYYYSLLGRDVERDVLPMMQHFDLGMTAWSPLAYGFLSGAYSRDDLSKPGNRFSDFDLLGFDKDKGFALLDIMRDIAAAHDITVAKVAVAWLLARRGVSSVLLGATKLYQLEDTLGAADVKLGDDDIARLDAATENRPLYPSSNWIQPDRRVSKLLAARP